VRAADTNKIILLIPRGLYGFKTSDDESKGLRVLSSRMHFERENQIRVINKNGLDTVMKLNYLTPDTNPVTLKSVC